MDWSTLIGMGPPLRLRRRPAQGRALDVRGAVPEQEAVVEAAVVEAAVGLVGLAVGVRAAAGRVAVGGRRVETRLISRQGFK